MTPSVTVYVASCGTRAATELCVRTLRRLAGRPFRLVVGDSGSRDGSAELLEALAARGWLELERADGPRSHAEWLDRWLAACETDYAVFVDSDVELRREGWLRALVATAESSGAALVAAELLPGGTFVEPVAGRRVHGASRPSPWLMLARVEPVRALAVGFGFHAEDSEDVPEGVVAYDVGARFLAELERQGLAAEAMPPGYRRAYRHYGGLSWLPLEGRRGRRKLRDLRRVERRLARVRRRDEGGGAVGGATRLLARLPSPRGLEAGGRALQRLLVRRPGSRLVLSRLRDGSVLRLDLASPTERGPAWSGRYEPELLRLALERLGPGAHAIDVGANVGLWTVPLARRLGGAGGRVLAFEPVAANHARLRENLALNGIDGAARTFRLALGDRAGTVELRLEDGAPTGNAVAYPPGGSDRRDGTAPLDTLDAVAEREGIQRCDFLKLDVEGAELAVLRGARRVLARHRPLVLAELNPFWMRRFGWDAADLEAFASELGYRVSPLRGHVLLEPEGTA